MAQFFDQLFIYDPVSVTWAATGIITLAVLVILVKTPELSSEKIILFLVIALTSIFTTLYLAGGTIHDNLSSATGGPVHWHADFRIFKCDEEFNLIDPIGLSNRVGSPEIHEHNDSRIHAEGTLKNLEEASLGGFFKVAGGSLTLDYFKVPTNNGLMEMRNGDRCAGGSPGTLQVFLWETKDGNVEQSKLDDFANYVMNPEPLIPPGDCLIFEFDFPKGKTEYVCEQYEVAEKRGDIEIAR